MSTAAPRFSLLRPDGEQRRQKRRSLGMSLVLQVGLWLALFSAFGRARFVSPIWQSPPEKLTWLVAPVLPPMAPPHRAARRPRPSPPPLPPRMRRRMARLTPTRHLLRGRPFLTRRLRAPQISVPAFIARAVAPTAPDPNNQPAVVMGALPRVPDPRPPQPAARTAVRLGAFADPPAVAPHGRTPPLAPAGPHLGAFGARAEAPSAPTAAVRRSAGVRLDSFHAAAATAAKPLRATAAVEINTSVFHPAAAPLRRVFRKTPAAIAAYQPPVILSKPQPVYPAAAEARGIEGVVVLQVLLMASGRVRVLAVQHGLGHAFDQAARQATLHIRFRPARRQGRAVDAVVRIRVRFRVAD